MLLNVNGNENRNPYKHIMHIIQCLFMEQSKIKRKTTVNISRNKMLQKKKIRKGGKNNKKQEIGNLINAQRNGNFEETKCIIYEKRKKF